MKVIVNNPAPVVQPPKTYDLIGVTATQIQVLRYIIGSYDTGKLVGTGHNRETVFAFYNDLCKTPL